MLRRPLVFVLGTLALAVALLVPMGLRVLERDRAALYDRYAHERQQTLDEAARGILADVSDLGEDLELAAVLLQNAETARVPQAALHAIATIRREFLIMYARNDDGETTKVSALDAPPDLAARSDTVIQELLDLAEREPGKLHISRGYLGVDDESAWYRVFARRPRQHGPAVAAVVNTAVLLARAKIPRDSMTRIAIFDANDATAKISDRALASLVRARPSAFAPLRSATRAGQSASHTIGDDLARLLGLPETSAVAIATPVSIDAGRPWTLMVIASTQVLHTQERTIARRVLVGGGLVMILLLSAAAYVLHNTFRARALRERLRHTERLAHLTEKAEKILDHIPSGVFALAVDRHISGVNRWLAERIGADVVGQPLERAFRTAREQDAALIDELVDRALETREAQSLHRERINLFGSDTALNIHAVPLAHGAGDVSLLLVLDDLTELRRIEQRLLHSEKLVTAGQLAAGIAHEVGTPLNVARGRVEISLAHLGATHAEADNQRVVIDQIDRVTRLVQHLLDYVRPTPAAVQDVDLAHVLRLIVDLLAAQATKRNVKLHVEAHHELLQLRADPDQLQQIVVNLTLNAIDACTANGNVWLRGRRTADRILLEVVDDGCGIPHELQKQVFDPFFTTKKRGQGTGLGLWVVAQLVRAQAGEIELESGVGTGTTVRIAWPVNR